MRMVWLAISHPTIFRLNFPIYIAAGSWKDIITMLNIDLQYHGWKNRQLDWEYFMNLIRIGLACSDYSELMKKYLPTIRTNSKCNTIESQADTIIGRWIARQIFPNVSKVAAFKQYRKLKSSGTAHIWQQQISKQLFNEIKFDKIAGRALSLLVNSNFLKNNNLVDKYNEWIKSQDNVKYTGFVFELFKPVDKHHIYQLEEQVAATINAQFNTLIQKASGGINTNSNLLVVRDVSGSMTYQAAGCNMSSYGVAKAMALYFSEFLKGQFANSYAIFSDNCKLCQWRI